MCCLHKHKHCIFGLTAKSHLLSATYRWSKTVECIFQESITRTWLALTSECKKRVIVHCINIPQNANTNINSIQLNIDLIYKAQFCLS